MGESRQREAQAKKLMTCVCVSRPHAAEAHRLSYFPDLVQPRNPSFSSDGSQVI